MDSWEELLSCATHCGRCERKLEAGEQRILSVYDHQAVCMPCKAQEEKRSDYPQVSKQAIGQCMMDTEIQYGDPEGYCFHHFYPFKC